MTQKELADNIEIKQGSISKIEQGLITPKDSTISSISRALEFPRNFFYQAFHFKSSATPLHRTRKSISLRHRGQVEALANILLLNLDVLLMQVDRRLNVPRIEVDEHENSPENIAFKLRKLWKIPSGPIENLTEILEDNGIFVIHLDFGTDLLDGFTLISDKGIPVVYVNEKMPGDRLRWTIAHELGHIIMHDFPTEQCEAEANTFASEFLMPEAEIFSSLENLSFTMLPDLKKYWQTSMWALIVWANKLGAIDQSRYKWLCMQMAKSGYRKSEPKYLAIPREKTALLGELISFHFEELGYNVRELQKMLCINQLDFDFFYGLTLPPSQNVIPFRQTQTGA